MTTLRHACGSMLIVVISAGIAVAATPPQTMMRGGRTVISGVRIACGEWGPTPNMPCLSRAKGNEPKIAIYALEPNEHIMKLAAAVEQEIQRDESLKWSYIVILDEKGPYRFRGEKGATYTRPETEKRLEEIRDLGAKEKIDRLTLGLSSSPRHKSSKQFELTFESDVLVTFLGTGVGANGKPQSSTILYLRRLDSESLNEESINELMAAVLKVHGSRN